MALRSLTRQLLIAGADALGLDAFIATRVEDAARLHRGHVVRVFYIHGTPRSHADVFRRYVAHLAERFNLITFETLKGLFAGGSIDRDDRPAALLTFDDGLANNYEVAAPILEEAGTRGVFFVVPKFSERTGDAAKQFFLEHIRPSLTPMGHEPMTPERIAGLAERGHTIGNHSLSHVRFSAIPEADYEREIVESASIIESWIGRPVEAFAWPFVWNAITPPAHRLAAARHAYCFAPCAGLTDACRDSRSLIWRTNLEPYTSDAEFRFQISGLADWISASRRGALAKTLLQ
jgi:peptidoglycan/xylan/chitin deacetylase (PgdA/CDA1 family)